MPIGCTAEQTSWTKPGRVRAAVRVPPPMVLGLEHQDPRPGLRETNSRGEAVRTRTNDDDVGLTHAAAQGCR